MIIFWEEITPPTFPPYIFAVSFGRIHLGVQLLSHMEASFKLFQVVILLLQVQKMDGELWSGLREGASIWSTVPDVIRAGFAALLADRDDLRAQRDGSRYALEQALSMVQSLELKTDRLTAELGTVSKLLESKADNSAMTAAVAVAADAAAISRKAAAKVADLADSISTGSHARNDAAVEVLAERLSSLETSMADDLNSIRASIAGLNNDISQLRSLVATSTTELSSLSRLVVIKPDLSEVHRLLSVKADADDVARQLEEKAGIDAINAVLATKANKTSVAAALDRKVSVSALDSALAPLAAKLEQLDAQRSSDGKDAKLADWMALLENRVASVETARSPATYELNALSAAVAALTAKAATIDAVERRLTEQSNEVRLLTAEMNRLKDSVSSGIRAELDKLSSAQHMHDKNSANKWWMNAVAKLQQQLDALSARIDSMQKHAQRHSFPASSSGCSDAQRHNFPASKPKAAPSSGSSDDVVAPNALNGSDLLLLSPQPSRVIKSSSTSSTSFSLPSPLDGRPAAYVSPVSPASAALIARARSAIAKASASSTTAAFDSASLSSAPLTPLERMTNDIPDGTSGSPAPMALSFSSNSTSRASPASASAPRGIGSAGVSIKATPAAVTGSGSKLKKSPILSPIRDGGLRLPAGTPHPSFQDGDARTISMSVSSASGHSTARSAGGPSATRNGTSNLKPTAPSTNGASDDSDTTASDRTRPPQPQRASCSRRRGWTTRGSDRVLPPQPSSASASRRASIR